MSNYVFWLLMQGSHKDCDLSEEMFCDGAGQNENDTKDYDYAWQMSSSIIPSLYSGV